MIDVSGDAGIRAFGRDFDELFVNAALGLYSLITDQGGIDEAKEMDLSVESDSIEGLLVAWLNELIFLFDAYGFLGRKIVIKEIPVDEAWDGRRLKLRAVVAGEEFDPERHERRLLVKAATYHRLKVEKTGETLRAEVIFDI